MCVQWPPRVHYVTYSARFNMQNTLRASSISFFCFRNLCEFFFPAGRTPSGIEVIWLINKRIKYWNQTCRCMCDHELWADNVCGQHSVWSSFTIKVHQVNQIKSEIYATITLVSILIVVLIENVICVGLTLFQISFNSCLDRIRITRHYFVHFDT